MEAWLRRWWRHGSEEVGDWAPKVVRISAQEHGLHDIAVTIEWYPCHRSAEALIRRAEIQMKIEISIMIDHALLRMGNAVSDVRSISVTEE